MCINQCPINITPSQVYAQDRDRAQAGSGQDGDRFFNVGMFMSRYLLTINQGRGGPVTASNVNPHPNNSFSALCTVLTIKGKRIIKIFHDCAKGFRMRQDFNLYLCEDATQTRTLNIIKRFIALLNLSFLTITLHWLLNFVYEACTRQQSISYQQNLKMSGDGQHSLFSRVDDCNFIHLSCLIMATLSEVANELSEIRKLTFKAQAETGDQTETFIQSIMFYSTSNQVVAKLLQIITYFNGNLQTRMFVILTNALSQFVSAITSWIPRTRFSSINICKFRMIELHLTIFSLLVAMNELEFIDRSLKCLSLFFGLCLSFPALHIQYDTFHRITVKESHRNLIL